MIELNSKTQQDFLNREWVQKLLDAGVDISDAKYCIGRTFRGDYVAYKAGAYNETLQDIIPTYTVSELLYKLHEYIYPIIDGEEYSGGLKFCKDAPFYIFYYALKTKEYDPQLQQGNYKEDYIYAEFEYPIESLAALLIQCHQKDIGLATKDTGSINDK
jgi:hypothetical protein